MNTNAANAREYISRVGWQTSYVLSMTFQENLKSFYARQFSKFLPRVINVLLLTNNMQIRLPYFIV